MELLITKPQVLIDMPPVTRASAWAPRAGAGRPVCSVNKPQQLYCWSNAICNKNMRLILMHIHSIVSLTNVLMRFLSKNICYISLHSLYVTVNAKMCYLMTIKLFNRFEYR